MWDWFMRLWRERRPVAINLIVALVLVLAGGVAAIAALGGGGDNATYVGPVPGGGGAAGGGPTTTAGIATGSSRGANAGPTPGSVPDEGEFDEVLQLGLDLSGRAGSVNTFWTEHFSEQFPGKVFEPPSKIVAYHDGKLSDTACARKMTPQEYSHNAWHCSTDHSLAYSEELLRELYDKFGDFAPVVFMGHEFGHHVATLAGEVNLRKIQKEQEADCLAGVAARGQMEAGVLNVADPGEGAEALFSGGTRGGKWWSTDAHGTPEQRRTAFLSGYFGSASDCIRIGRAALGPVVKAPPFEIFVVNGSTGEQLQNGGVRLTTPGTTVRAEIRSYRADELAGSGDAQARFDAVWQSWFHGANVTHGERFVTIPLKDPDGQVTNQPINEMIGGPPGTVWAQHYQQNYNGTPIHGVFLALVLNSGEGLVVDAYDTTAREPIDWKSVYQTYFDLLSAIHTEEG
jgi:hypothetical protein